MLVGLREANQRFSKIIQVVRDGEEVTLTERGRPVARIIPIRATEDPEAAIRRMVAAGVLRPAKRHWRMPPFKPRPLRGPSIVQTIREERDSS
jgi:prevent-host-death family protein